MSTVILYNLMIILIAGLVSGIISKRFGIPMVIGYLLAGALIGEGGFNLFFHGDELKNAEVLNQTSVTENETVDETLPALADENQALSNREEIGGGTDEAISESVSSSDENAEMAKVTEAANSQTASSSQASAAAEPSPEASKELMKTVVTSEEYQKETIDRLANLGALFLLFSIGIHFAPSELSKIKTFLFVGGPLQMFGVIIPLALIAWGLSGDWRLGILIGCAVSLSSTVLVFKSLDEFGQAASPYGKRAVSILLFQDIATAPILLMIPLLFMDASEGGSISETLLLMGAKALFFIILIVGIRSLFNRRGIKLFAQLRSVELMVLFTVVLLFLVCSIADRLELPDAIGAFAAGVALSENRLSDQIAALIVPFRETFSAVFFVSLGALFDIRILIAYPTTTFGLLIGLLLLKTIAGGIAFKVLGLSFIPSFAMGLGISQLGELSFIILQQGPFRADHPILYQQILFVALSSIILTPPFLKLAMNIVRKRPFVENAGGGRREMLLPPGEGKRTAIVIGLGPIGKRVTSFMESFGIDVCLVDMNPMNLQAYAQEGFRTITGDATEKTTLKHAQIDDAKLVVITIPNDIFATNTIQAIRATGSDCSIVVRCRYTASILPLTKAGADLVICEETEAGGRLVECLEPLI